jgi:hypothetical protein
MNELHACPSVLAHLRNRVRWRIAVLILALVVPLYCPVELLAQSKFLYGMYAIGWGENEGITWNGSGYNMRTGPGGARLMNFWYDSLGMNTFFVNNSNFPEGGEDNAPYVNFLYKTYAAHPTPSRNFIRESKIIPIYRCFSITRASETHYLKFSPATRSEGNLVEFDTSRFRVVSGDTSFFISASGGTSMARLIRDITVRGGEDRQIRPREYNTRGTNAYFKLRFRFYSAQAGHALSVRLTNRVSSAGRRNHQFVNATHSVTAGHSEAVFPFSMDLKPADEIYEIYACRLGLTVNCSMSSGSSFQIKDITVYDDSGRVVVEEPARFYSTPQRKDLDKSFRDIARDMAGSTYAPKVYPIIALADEPHVGNYAPMNAVTRHFLQVDSRLTFYTTWPDDEFLHANRATVTRLAKLPIRYIAPNHYLFRNDILDHRRSILRDYDALSGFCRHLLSIDSTRFIISVPPLFSSGTEFRAPTQSEILASAYISLLVGAKGVVYYYGGPFHGHEEPLYSYHDMNDPPDKMFSTRHMHSHKVAALKTFASFINKNSGESGGLSSGSLISTYGVDDDAIIGTTDGTDNVNSRTFAAGRLGTAAKAEITDVTLVDATGRIRTNSNMVGVAHLKDNASAPYVSYFLIANLNSSASDIRLKISLRSTHSRPYLRVNNITYSGDLANSVLSRSGSVTTTLPAHGAMILKVENRSTR